MPEFENATVVYIDKNNAQYRSTVSFTIRQISLFPKQIYKLEKKGEGACDKYGEIFWKQNAVMEEIDGFLYTQESNCAIKDAKGKLLTRYERRYDYLNKKIYWRQFNENNTLIKEAVFPIKGKTCDDITLPFFLKPYVAHRGEKRYRSYYLLSNEPKLYKVIILPQGEEKLSLPLGEIKAVKLKLRSDISIIDDVLDRFVPQTFIWYSSTEPYVWLKYEGLETGFPSAYVTTILTDYSGKIP
ncbi:MAG: hypothetical protein JSV34_05825 [Candidatus Omnitrophota bacterium]|nr:MAG: hypothetical protein JSV34_05825 [Candidatus Omnitrophota bacterium]